MDKLAELSHGAKVVLGAAIAFLLFSFFSWFKYTGPGADQIEAVGGDIGVTMWHGVGWIAGLLAIALIVWQAIRLANIQFEIGVTPSMVTAALAVLMLIFTVIRFIDKPGNGDFVGRTFWAWLCLVLAVVVVVGAWMNMQAAGESLGDIRDRVGSMTGGGESASPAAAAPAAPAATPPASEPTPPPAPPASEAAVDEASGDEPTTTA